MLGIREHHIWDELKLYQAYFAHPLLLFLGMHAYLLKLTMLRVLCSSMDDTYLIGMATLILVCSTRDEHLPDITWCSHPTMLLSTFFVGTRALILLC